MKLKIRNIFTFLMALFAAVAITSCVDDGPKHPDNPDNEKPTTNVAKRTILVYAVSANNLYYNLVNDTDGDKKEMLDIAPALDLKNYNVLVYSCPPYNMPTEVPTLQKLTVSDSPEGKASFTVLKEYETEDASGHISSTDPKRIREVISDIRELATADDYGIIFWSHASAWSPGRSRYEDPFFSFGEDNSGGTSETIDVDQLAACLDPGVFSFVWFDCCYMSNIETIYEFRDKVSTIVAYPTEIYSEGLPYDVVLPYLCKEKPNFTDAAKGTFDWYNNDYRAVTITVMDMTKIEAVADATAKIFARYVMPKSFTGKVKYSRGIHGPFYDFRQLASMVAEETGNSAAMEALDKALADFVLYHAVSPKDFNSKFFDVPNCSGISAHALGAGTAAQENFYKTLGWYNRVYFNTAD